MKNTNKNGSTRMGYTPIKAPNGKPQGEPKSVVMTSKNDLRVKVGK